MENTDKNSSPLYLWGFSGPNFTNSKLLSKFLWIRHLRNFTEERKEMKNIGRNFFYVFQKNLVSTGSVITQFEIIHYNLSEFYCKSYNDVGIRNTAKFYLNPLLNYAFYCTKNL